MDRQRKKNQTRATAGRKGILFVIMTILVLSLFTIIAEAHAATKTTAAKKTVYTVKYYPNKGKNPPKKLKKLSAKKKLSVKLSKIKPTRKGYTFQKWNTKKNGKGKSYRPGAKVRLTCKKNILKLYAQWKKAKKTEKKTENKTSEKTEEKKEEEPAKGVTPLPPAVALEVHFIDVGQGDATLVMCNGESMLIDAGDNTKGTAIQSYLMSHGVSRLKYAIGTHPDADHIGGLDVVITKFAVDNLFMPKISKDTRTYDDVVQAAKYKSLKIQQPTSGAWYTLGKAKFQVVSVDKDYGDEANNWSICIRLVYGNSSFLLVGDAEEEAENDMINSGYELESDVYKVAHHGSRTGSIQAFMDKVKPSCAVISCGEGNSYGHPHAAVLNTLRSTDVQTYRTDEQGTIIALTDGDMIYWNVSPTTSWIAGEPTGGSPQGYTRYILNTNSKKFHTETCEAAESISEKNKEYSSKSRDELIAEGYSPCGICKP